MKATNEDLRHRYLHNCYGSEGRNTYRNVVDMAPATDILVNYHVAEETTV